MYVKSLLDKIKEGVAGWLFIGSWSAPGHIDPLAVAEGVLAKAAEPTVPKSSVVVEQEAFAQTE